MPEPELLLLASCLTSKWGFSDGDLVEDFLWYLLEAGLVAENAHLSDVDNHAVLRDLVRERLLPAIPLHVVVYDIETNHNPIRAASVDGVDVDDYAVGDQQAERLLASYSVTIPWRDVVRVAGLEVVPGEAIG